MRYLTLIVLALALSGCAIGSTFDDEPMVGLRVGEKTVANAVARVGKAIPWGDIAAIGGPVGALAAIGAGLWGKRKGERDGFDEGAQHADAAHAKANAAFDEGRAVAAGALPVVAGAAGASGGGGAPAASGVTP